MDFIFSSFTDWLKEILVSGIMDNLSGMFDNVNTKVGEIGTQVASTPQSWNGQIYNMIKTLSDNVILPIAGIKELGKQLKKIGMLIVQDQVWNRVKGIQKMMKYLEADEKELMAMSRSLLDKLGNMSDEEFDELEKYPDF